MTRPRNAVLSYLRHGTSGQAVVKITTPDGRRKSIYLGVYNSDASRREYERVIATLRTSPVPGLRKGRGEAKELPSVRPTSDADLEKVISAAAPCTAALMRVQSLSGARAGELVGLKGSEIDCSGKVWKATVTDHKGEWQGKTRVLYFGPLAQAELAPLVEKAAGGFVFVNETGEPFRTAGYCQAVQRACKRAKVAKFGTHAIRHYAATRIRKLMDVETARVLYRTRVKLIS